MPGWKNLTRYWLPVFLWMAFVFAGSGSGLSSHQTSRFLGPLFHWLYPELAPESVDRLVFLIRKCAHVCEYAVLAFLLWRALFQPRKGVTRAWSWQLAALAWAGASVYAATDELHQAFVPGRGAACADVALDSCGAALGIVLIWSWGKWRKRW